ncbi:MULTISPECIES: hypothetical protein [Empedobacter]|uniref:Uncharacterized protein n=1 Tax=Empedobacter falsenii TaxID=343874 RepID=A0A376G2W2_9FLAO|nr:MULTISPECIES: hypothetical protein [Empedobacter]QLL56997.1 hypothetical protein FH779_02340 [Empedobacter falsenii]STD54301.1 Uncharacterised protein [Empedobacter falsenii]HBX61935.1 hypothetical protein [Flavobacteriaceae bacterium]
MDKIKFIPLIEPPILKDNQNGKILQEISFNNSIEWDSYQKNQIDKIYTNFPQPIQSGIYQYNLLKISLANMEKIINLHLADTKIVDSISLFGGYAISINNKIELFPQCCGLLEEIQLWKNILNKNFSNFYLTECHPSPLITKSKNEIVIICDDENESFIPINTNKEIRIDYNQTKKAFIVLLNELEAYSNKLNNLSHKFEIDNLSDIIIWGEKS